MDRFLELWAAAIAARWALLSEFWWVWAGIVLLTAVVCIALAKVKP